MDKMRVYNALPVALQNVACNYEGHRIIRSRFGGSFERILGEYKQRLTWSADQLAAYRDQRLSDMVQHCYQRIPYYKRLFNEGGISPDSIQHLEDLAKLPVLTKARVNAAPDEFLDSNYRGKRIKGHSSGTTGSAISIYMTEIAVQEQWACWWRYREALGIGFGCPHAVFGTRKVVPISQGGPPYWRYNKPARQIYFSAFHMSDSNLGAYYEELRDSGIAWIHGYPSLLCLLAKYMIERDLELPGVKWVTTGAENLHSHQFNLLKEAFSVVPFNHYGMCEGVANFSQRKDGQMFVDEDYAAVEFIKRGDGLSEVVGTTLTNRLMPLLRYRVGDVATVAKSISGRRVVVSLDGRSEDYVYLPNGIKVGKLDHVFKDTKKIAEAQIIQNEDYSITIVAVKTADNVDDDERIALRELKSSLSASLPVRFKYVESIPRTPSGKVRFVISKVNDAKL